MKKSGLPAIENENDIKLIFENLKLIKKGQLKRSALLLFGKDPREYAFNAYAKIGKFGKSDDELLSQDVIDGNAFQLADKILDVSEKTAFRDLEKLVQLNILRKEGEKKGTIYQLNVR